MLKKLCRFIFLWNIQYWFKVSSGHLGQILTKNQFVKKHPFVYLIHSYICYWSFILKIISTISATHVTRWLTAANNIPLRADSGVYVQWCWWQMPWPCREENNPTLISSEQPVLMSHTLSEFSLSASDFFSMNNGLFCWLIKHLGLSL